MKPDRINLMNIPGLQDAKVTQSFILYILQCKLNLGNRAANFTKVKAPFGVATITHAIGMYSTDNSTLQEVLLLCKAGNETPTALCYRVFIDGKYVAEYTDFVQFIIEPYSKDGVMELIAELPAVLGS